MNAAAHMESNGQPGCIHVSQAYRQLAAGSFLFEERGTVELKGIGTVQSFFLDGPLPAVAASAGVALGS